MEQTTAKVRKPLVFTSDEDLGIEASPSVHVPYGLALPRVIDSRPALPSVVVDLKSSTPEVDLPVPARPLTGPTAEQMDREFDLKHNLVTRNQARDCDKHAMQEDLYHLHKLMAETGRAGRFAPFLRKDLGWDDKHAYTRAMRWIAAYELRAGLIDEETYKKRMGNGSTTLRSDSPADRPTAPPFVQSFTIEAGDAGIITPDFTSEEIAEDAKQIGARRLQLVGTVLHRAVLPQGQRDWYDFAWQQQARRHHVKTYKDTLLAVFLRGTRKAAAADDEWGCLLDQMLNDIGRNPALALQPDPSETHDWGELGGGFERWESESPEDTNYYNDHEDDTEIATAPVHEVSLDDFEDVLD